MQINCHNFKFGKITRKKVVFEHYFRDKGFVDKLFIDCHGSVEHLYHFNNHGTQRQSDTRSTLDKIHRALGTHSYFTLSDIHRKTDSPLQKISFYSRFGEAFQLNPKYGIELASNGIVPAEEFDMVEKLHHRIANIHISPITTSSGFTSLENQRMIARSIVNIEHSVRPERFEQYVPVPAPATPFFSVAPSFLAPSALPSLPSIVAPVVMAPPSMVNREVRNSLGQVIATYPHILQEFDFLILLAGELNLYTFLTELFSLANFKGYREIRILACRSVSCGMCNGYKEVPVVRFAEQPEFVAARARLQQERDALERELMAMQGPAFAARHRRIQEIAGILDSDIIDAFRAPK